MYTHIPELDRLLGIHQDSYCSKNDLYEIVPNSILLIRGEPGSGKTTLGLQILSYYLNNNQNNSDVLFFSLEIDPEEAILKAKNKFNFYENNEDENRIHKFDSNSIELFVRHFVKKEKTSLDLLNLTITSISKFIKKDVSVISDLLKATKYNIDEYKYLKKYMEINKKGINPKIILIDSLNVLLHTIKKYDDRIHERLLLNLLCSGFKRAFADSVIIFTGEYHFQDVNKETIVSESFYCDIEIALFPEPIFVSNNYDTKFQSPVGSNISSLSNQNKTSIRTQSFCRILKSRNTPNQARRCSYDIVAGKGIEFYPTYPGDGQLILFAENNSQREVWDSFFKEDLPNLFPALRYEHFDRSSLQRTSSAYRQFWNMPKRTDVLLASIDNYWISWYTGLCKKWTIVDIFHREFNLDYNEFKRLPEIINLITAQVIKSYDFKENIYKSISCSISKYKQLSKIDESKIIESIWNNLSKDNAYSCIRCIISCYLIDNDLIDNKLIDNPDFYYSYKSILKKCFIKLIKMLMHIPTENYIYKNVRDDIIDSVVKSFDIKIRNDIDLKLILKVFYNAIISPRCKNNLIVCKKDLIIPIIRKFKEGNENKIYDEFRKILCPFCKSTSKQLTKLKASLISFLTDNSIITEYHLEGQTINNIVDDICSLIFNDPNQKMFSGKFSDDLIKELGYKLNKNASNISITGLYNLADILLKLIDNEDSQYHMFSKLPKNQLRLFGERQSDIIQELNKHCAIENRPIHLAESLFPLKDPDFFISVPYDANISFFVFRSDIINDFVNTIKGDKNKYVELIKKIIVEEEIILEAILALDKEIPPDKKYKNQYINDFGKANLKIEIEELVTSFINTHKIETWEELIALFLYIQEEIYNKDKFSLFNSDLHFLIETRTFDTFLCMMLEILWNCGGNLHIYPDYSFNEVRTEENKCTTKKELLRTFYILAKLFGENIIPTTSTLAVEEFAKEYGKKSSSNKDWVFARHWYSTLIDLLSAKHIEKESKIEDHQLKDINVGNYIWQCKDNTKIDIMPIPISFSKYKKDKKHISCWGDWHLAVIDGSENVKLGVDLIDYLMCSERVCDRAFANAALPTVESFYEQYGERKCINLPERNDIELPDATYNDLRNNYFINAKSRSQVSDYRHCMLEFHSILEYVRFSGNIDLEKDKNSLSDEEKMIFTEMVNKLSVGNNENINNKKEKFLIKMIKTYGKITQAISRIEKFKSKPLLMT